MVALLPLGVVIVLSMVFIQMESCGGLIWPKTMLIGFAVRLVLGAVSMAYHAAFLLSMVFGYGGLFPWGFVTCRNGNHA